MVNLEELRKVANSIGPDEWDPDYMSGPASRFAATFNPALVAKLLDAIDDLYNATQLVGGDSQGYEIMQQLLKELKNESPAD